MKQKVKRFLCFSIVAITVMNLFGTNMGTGKVQAENDAKVKIASMTCSNPINTSYPASNAIDGDCTSTDMEKHALGQFGQDNPIVYFEATLEKLSVIDTVVLYFSNHEPQKRPNDIAIDVKKADGTWVRVAAKQNYDYNGDTAAKVLREDYKFAPVEATTFRVVANQIRNHEKRQGTSDANWSTIKFVEIEALYNGNLSSEEYTGVAALDDTKYQLIYPDAKIVSGTRSENSEGDLKTLWDDDTASNKPGVVAEKNTYANQTGKKLAWFTFDFDSASYINQVTLSLYEGQVRNRPEDLALDVYTETDGWKRVAEIHNKQWEVETYNYDSWKAKETEVTFNFEGCVAKEIRVIANLERRTQSAYNPPADCGQSLTLGGGNLRLVEVDARWNPEVKEYTGTVKDANDQYNMDEIYLNVIEEVTAGGRFNGSIGTLPNGQTSFLHDHKKILGGGDFVKIWYPLPNNGANSTTADYTAYFEGELKEATSISEVRLYYDVNAGWQSRARDMAIDVYTEDMGWVRVAEMHNLNWVEDYSKRPTKVAGNDSNMDNNQEFLSFIFPDVTATKFRVTAYAKRNVDLNSGEGNFLLKEIEVYSNPTADDTGAAKDETYNIPLISGDTTGDKAVYYCKDIATYRGDSVNAYHAPEEDGYLFAGWFSDLACTKPINSDMKKGAAYGKYVDEAVLSVKTQLTAGTTAESKSTDMRFLTTVDSLRYNRIGFTITANGYTNTYSSPSVYKKVQAMKGGEQVNVEPTEFSVNSKYFKACLIQNINMSYKDMEWKVTPHWETMDGTKVYGECITVKISDMVQTN